jgi:hypothetical protein
MANEGSSDTLVIGALRLGFATAVLCVSGVSDCLGDCQPFIRGFLRFGPSKGSLQQLPGI